MNVTVASLTAPGFLTKYRLALTWKDSNRLTFAKPALKYLSHEKLDYTHTPTLAALKMFLEFPNQELHDSILKRNDLPERVQLWGVQSKYPNSIDRVMRATELPKTVQDAFLARFVPIRAEGRRPSEYNDRGWEGACKSLICNPKFDLSLVPIVLQYRELYETIIESIKDLPKEHVTFVGEQVLKEVEGNTSKYDYDAGEAVMLHKHCSVPLWVQLYETGIEKGSSYNFASTVLEKLKKGKVKLVVA